MIEKLTHEEIVNRQMSRLPRDRFPVSALLTDVRSMHNVGSMFRTADGANLEKLYLTGITGRPPDKRIQKTALGAEQHVPWSYGCSAKEEIARLRSVGTQILVLEQTRQSFSYDLAPVRFPCCLVVGNEITGVDPELTAVADLALEIPMQGIKNSLNVSVAFGIVVYELARRYAMVGAS